MVDPNELADQIEFGRVTLDILNTEEFQTVIAALRGAKDAERYRLIRDACKREKDVEQFWKLIAEDTTYGGSEDAY